MLVFQTKELSYCRNLGQILVFLSQLEIVGRLGQRWAVNTDKGTASETSLAGRTEKKSPLEQKASNSGKNHQKTHDYDCPFRGNI